MIQIQTLNNGIVYKQLINTNVRIGDPQKQIETYSDAIKTIDIPQSVGKVHELWVSFAGFYDKNGQLDDVRSILSIYKYIFNTFRKDITHLTSINFFLF